jgi:hypothetical protein
LGYIPSIKLTGISADIFPVKSRGLAYKQLLSNEAVKKDYFETINTWKEKRTLVYR